MQERLPALAGFKRVAPEAPARRLFAKEMCGEAERVQTRRRSATTRRPVRRLHRDRFVDVDCAADLEDRAALRELDRRIEAFLPTRCPLTRACNQAQGQRQI